MKKITYMKSMIDKKQLIQNFLYGREFYEGKPFFINLKFVKGPVIQKRII